MAQEISEKIKSLYETTNHRIANIDINSNTIGTKEMCYYLDPEKKLNDESWYCQEMHYSQTFA